MIPKAVPMIHVPDVRATVEWYRDIGFIVNNTYDNDGDGLSFAILSFGSSQVMFNEGGRPSTSNRREVDLYVYTEQVDELYERLKDQVDVIEGPHDTFYGMHEFILRDLNRFWITFGQESVFGKLLNGVRDENVELVREVLASPGLKPATLTAALEIALSAAPPDAEILQLLKDAGAVLPPDIDIELLQSYAGTYKGEQGFAFTVTFEDGKLFAAAGSQQPLRLLPLDTTTFRPLAFDNFGTLTFNVEDGKVQGLALNHDGHIMPLRREAKPEEVAGEGLRG